MIKSRHSKAIAALAGGATLGSAATLAVVFLLPSFNDEEANNWRSEIPSTALDEVSKTAGSSIAVQHLEDVLQLQTDFDRNAALYQLLLASTEQTLLELLDEAKSLDADRHRHTAERVIFQKLASLNPQIALDQVGRMPTDSQGDLISTIFEEWSFSDLDEAIRHVLELDLVLKQAALQGILTANHNLSMDILKGIATQLENEAFAVDFLSEAVALSAHEDPASAWDRLVFDNQPNLAQTEFLIQVASEWLLQEGISVIDQISESLRDEVVRHAVITSVLHRITQEDPQAALLAAVNLTGNSRELVLRTIAEVWAWVDPEAALASISTLVSGSELNILQESVLEAWAANDPNGLLELLDVVPEHLRAMATEESMLAIARISPEDAALFLSDLEDSDLRNRLAKEIATYWSKQDPHAALDWVLNENFATNVQQAETLMIVLSSLATKDPDLAFQTARDQPIVLRGQYYRGMEVTVIQQLVETNIDEALAMLSDIRSAGLTLTHAYSEVGRAMIRDGQFDRALALGERLDERRRRNYNSSLMYQWAMAEPETLFASLEKLPSDQLKDQAAKGLMRYNSDTKALSSEQMEQVASFLPDDYVDSYNNVRQMRRAATEWFDNQVQGIFLNTRVREGVE